MDGSLAVVGSFKMKVMRQDIVRAYAEVSNQLNCGGR